MKFQLVLLGFAILVMVIAEPEPQPEALAGTSLGVIDLKTSPVGVAYAPNWDDETQRLCFVNYATTGMEFSIFCYDSRNGIFYSAYIEGVTSPSFIIPVNKCIKSNECKDNLFAVGNGSDVVLIEWNVESTKAIVVKHLFSVNDNPYQLDTAVADKHGRFYGGVFNGDCNKTASRSFYRWTKNEGVVRLFGSTQSTTGIVFDEENCIMYHLDTCQLLITGFKYDKKTGDICYGRVVFKFPTDFPINPYSPAGLAIDKFGFLYTTTYSGQVWKIDPSTGNVVEKITLPRPAPSAVAFGGPRCDKLYVVFQAINMSPASADVAQQIRNGTSLAVITGLVGSRCCKCSNRLNIK